MSYLLLLVRTVGGARGGSVVLSALAEHTRAFNRTTGQAGLAAGVDRVSKPHCKELCMPHSLDL